MAFGRPAGEHCFIMVPDLMIVLWSPAKTEAVLPMLCCLVCSSEPRPWAGVAWQRRAAGYNFPLAWVSRVLYVREALLQVAYESISVPSE